MAQLKDTIVNGSLTVADAAAITGPTQISSGDLTLYTASTGNSPALVFQRGALNDNYNDWQIQDRGGILCFDQRGISSTAFSKVLGLGTDSSIQFTSNGYTGTLKPAPLTASRTWTLPDKTGTIALTSDYGIATYNTSGLVKPWYSHTVASTGLTAGSDSNAIAVNSISTTAGRYYAVEMDSEGRMFVNVPWASGSGGSNVTWNQSVTTGTQIASITIDNTTTDIYTPVVPSTYSDVDAQQEPLIIYGTAVSGTDYYTTNYNCDDVSTALAAGRDVFFQEIDFTVPLTAFVGGYGYVFGGAFASGNTLMTSGVLLLISPDHMALRVNATVTIPSSVPTTASSATTGITATTTANTTTVGSHSTDYGVKTAGSGSFTSGAFFGGSFTQGSDSFTTNTPTVIDTTKFNAGSYSHSGFGGGSGSFSATVTSHVLSFSHTHTAATYGTDSFTAPSLSTGFYTAGTAASFTQGDDTFSPATHGADSHTHTAPTLGSKVPTVSTASATVSITDPGHTHSLT